MASGPQAAHYGAPVPQGGVGMMPPQQQPFKGTLAPGTRVQVGSITVTVKKYLSEGGFAHVYLVTTSSPIPMPSSSGTTSSNTPSTRGEYTHVLKRMAVPDKEALTEVRGEVEVHKLLRNQPHIVHFIEASATSLPRGGYEIFILMEFCAGGGIIDLMNARLRDRLREDEVLKIFADVCDGLSVMHHLDPPMMHRDLKVENILLAPPSNRGGPPVYKLCDFGSASPVLSRRAPKSIDEIRRVEADLNKHTTLQYRAPEMVDPYQRRVIDEKADIWALGVLLYKLCYYTTPFEENGGGPLAILNARYRFPSNPPYSQRIKDLIASLLQEQSAARPSIDEVLIRTHSLLGTRPPASALHYAQQAAAGKIATPLPSVSSASTSTSSGADLEARRIAAAQSQSSDGADLIRLGPSEAERAKAEAEAFKKQNESITPMRRGRPGKEPPSSSAKPLAPEASSNVPKTSETPKMKLQLTGDRSASTVSPDHKDAWKQPSGSFSKAAGALDSKAASFGFGDSFQPSLSPSIAAPSLSRSGSAHGTPIQHSPALPGFNPSPSPRPSPLSSPPPVSASPSGVSLLPPVNSTAIQVGKEDPEASSRFPSVEELDAKYASPPSTSPISSSSTSFKPPISIPGSESRSNLSSIAGRFERQGGTSAADGGSVSRRWPPVGGATSSLSASSGDIKASGSSARAQRARGSESNRHSMFPSSSSSTLFPASSGLRPAKSGGALRDSVTGGSHENAPTLPERREIPAQDWITEGGISSNRSGLSPKMESLGKAYKSPSRYNSAPTASQPKREKPVRMDSTASDSSGDEGPEDLDSRKRFSQLPSQTQTSPKANDSLPFSKRWGSESQPSSQPSLQSVAPGKVKTPAWALNKGSENVSPLALPTKNSAAVLTAAKFGAAADMGEQARGLERDENGEPVAPLSSDTESSVGEERQQQLEASDQGLLSPATRAKARAPDWDEDDAEQIAMRNGASPQTEIGTLVDLSSRQASLSTAPPTKHLLDEDNPPMEEKRTPFARGSVERVDPEEAQEVKIPEDAERAKFVASPSPASPPPLVAPRAKPISSSRSNVGGMLSRYESISSGLSNEAPALPKAGTKPSPTSTRNQSTTEEGRNDFSEERKTTVSPVQSKAEPSPHQREATSGGSGFINQRQRSLLNDSKPVNTSNGASVSSSTTGTSLSNRSYGSFSRGSNLASASRSETAPVARQPPFIGSKQEMSTSSTVGLKPWEREAAELEEINRQGGVKAAKQTDSDDLLPSNSPSRDPQFVSPGAEKPNHLRPGHSTDGGNDRSSSVGNLISQWQKNAESNAPGWGKIGESASRRESGMGDVGRRRQRLPGADV